MVKSVQVPKLLPIKDIQIQEGFWAQRQNTNRNRTIPSIYQQMDITGRLDAWRLDWKPGQPKPHIFWDSDAGKWIQAVAYSLAAHPNPEFEAQVDAVVDLIEKAQQPDGYLNIYYTAVEPENRWRNLRDRHELYDAGHLMEGAVAYYQATGKRELLDVLSRYADHIDRRFGPNEGQKRGYCGHPEVELALVKLYEATGEKRYLNLSKYFVDERGQQPHYFDLEARERGEDPREFWAKTYRYCQAHVPVREQTTAVGHSVRACYLYSGMADIAAQTDDTELADVCRSIWEDLTQHQMYITGGLGPAHSNEGFTFPYDLPNEEAYAETCASVALVGWAQRMFHLDSDRRYIDVVERALYNGVLSGVSFEGSHFFYANPLAAYPNVNPYPTSTSVLTDGHYRRSEWFECACCPPNLARMVASVGQYFYSVKSDTVYVNLYNQNRTNLQVQGSTVQIDEQTNYPWDGDVHFTINTENPTQFKLALRIPGWCRDFNLAVNGKPTSTDLIHGYSVISREWANSDEVTLHLAMPIERIVSHPDVRQNAGCIALQHGPIVYCVEEVDNGPQLANIALPRDAQLTAKFDNDLFGGISVITGEAMRLDPRTWPGDLYQPQSALTYPHSPISFKAIPYCFWANRQPGEMRVWIHES